MPRYKNKNQKESNFTKLLHKSGKQLKFKIRIIVTALTIVMIVLVVGVGLILSKKDKTNPLAIDISEAKATGIPGWWYRQYFGSSVCQEEKCRPDADPDNDKLTNAQEFYYHTNPLNPDTNGNGLTDGQDVAQGYDPSKPGKVTFDEVASDDSIVGESILFDEDAVKAFSEVTDLSKVKTPEINDAELKISNNNSKESIVAYFNKLDKTVSQYFPESVSSTIADAVKSQDQNKINDIKIRSVQTVIALKALEVPSEASLLHKNYIAILQLLPSVVTIPAEQEIANQESQIANSWFDQTQSFAYLMQQIDAEIKKLQDKYK